MRIFLKVELPDELAGEFLKLVRSFDLRHDPNHEGKIAVQQLLESDWPMDRMEAMLRAVMPTGHMYTKKAGEA